MTALKVFIFLGALTTPTTGFLGFSVLPAARSQSREAARCGHLPSCKNGVLTTRMTDAIGDPDLAKGGRLMWSKYDAEAIGNYYREHPWEVFERLGLLTRCVGGVGVVIVGVFFQGQRGKTLISSSGKALADALAEAGPTYSKFGQALSCRPDLVGEAVAGALQELQDRVPAFDNDIARQIIREELGAAAQELLDTMGRETVAAATLGQVYRAKVGGNAVAVKVQRPGIMRGVAADSFIVRWAAAVLELLRDPSSGDRLIKPALVDGCDEFFSRLFEESDYQREASNLARFAALYAGVKGQRGSKRIIVPALYPHLSTRRVITMEWVEGTRISDRAVVSAADLPTLRLGIECSLSQCLEKGLMHADPHGGNLLKTADGLAYLDFGMVSEVPEQVREGLLRAVAYVVAGEYGKVAALFGELMLIPQEVIDDPAQLAELTCALESVASAVLRPRPHAEADPKEAGSRVPELRFDMLISSLASFAPRFRFTLPPYFLNNARAIGALEGLAKSADPSFNILSEVYSFAIRQLLTSESAGMRKTLKELTYDPISGKPDFARVKLLVREAAAIAGKRKRRVVWDAAKTRGGRRFAARALLDAASL